MPRPSDPQARTRLLAAAERVFIAHGLERAKVEDIARGAGLSKGAFYLHFRTKDDAFREILSSALDELAAILTETESTRNLSKVAPYEEVIANWLEQDLRIFSCIWKNRPIMRLVLEGGGSPDYQHLIDLFAENAHKTTERLVKHGIESGFYRQELDADQAAAFVAGGYDRLARRLVREKRKPNLERWLIGAHELCIRALGTQEFIAAAVNVHAARLSETSRRKASA
jgi:AcrR family transcriptional regulator